MVAGRAASYILRKSLSSITGSLKVSDSESKQKNEPASKRWTFEIAITSLALLFGILTAYITHSNAYANMASDPTVILSSGRVSEGNRVIIDDYREAYYWLK